MRTKILTHLVQVVCRHSLAVAETAVKKAILVSLVVTAAGSANANIPSGITGLWQFPSSANKLKATVGFDLTTSNPSSGSFWTGPWIMIGWAGNAGLYAEGGLFQDWSWEYLTVNPGFASNGGGDYVNEYTIMWDVRPENGLNSLYQTAYGGTDNDGDLWIVATNRAASIVGVDAVGFSTNTFDGTKWHRVILSVKNGEFFRVYVDGTNYLEGAGQAVDGRFALYPNRFHLFADDNWQDAWTFCGTVATWNHALTADQVAAMGGWIDGSDQPTVLLFTNTTPELLSVSPVDGTTNASPEISYQALILDPARLIATTNAQLLLDGVPTQAISRSGAMLVASLSGGLFPSGSTHTYTLIAGVSGMYITNVTTITVQKYTGYEWRFTNGDLSTALGNGEMAYADLSTTAGLTTFGTTDGSSVPHINGSPAKYMHVPGFTSDTDGYLLRFNDSGPNVGTNAYLNRYTLLMDLMVPSPWPLTWIVPFFNTDPYNLNDADFYLYGDGSIGTGSGGYSATNVVKADTWCRLAFVADLEANTLTYYVDGSKVKSRAADGLEGRWSLYSNQDVPPYPASLFLFNEGDTSGTYTHELYVSSIAFADRALSAGEIAALGGPSANGILVPSVASRPSLTIRPSAGGATVSWPTNYVGYRLEQADNLIAPQWKSVGGITNNTANISTIGSAQFYRLAQ